MRGIGVTMGEFPSRSVMSTIVGATWRGLPAPAESRNKWRGLPAPVEPRNGRSEQIELRDLAHRLWFKLPRRSGRNDHHLGIENLR
jgi:hypothetical protein